jgi:hypothetical protein
MALIPTLFGSITVGQVAALAAAAALPQRSRPIFFLLMEAGVPRWGAWLQPRPEDLSYNYPTRATVIQTLGGAYVDDFGEGVCEIALSGTTAYKQGPLSNLGLGEIWDDLGLNLEQGDLMFVSMRDWLVKRYHDLRLAHANAGLDPNLVQLIWVDTLNLTAWVVYPLVFGLRRSRNRPLLYQYHMRMVGIEQLA